MTTRKQRVFKYIFERYEGADLSSHVQEIMALKSANLNNRGIHVQLEFLLQEAGLDWLEQVFLRQPLRKEPSPRPRPSSSASTSSSKAKPGSVASSLSKQKMSKKLGPSRSRSTKKAAFTGSTPKRTKSTTPASSR